MVLEIKYVDANNAVIHTENLGTGIWYPPSRPSKEDHVCLNVRCHMITYD